MHGFILHRKMRIRFVVIAGFCFCSILSIVSSVYFYSERFIHKNPQVYSANVTTQVRNEWKLFKNKTGSTFSAALRYCNFPSAKDYTTTQEGLKPHHNLTLQQVIVVLRHGDRSPMSHKVYKKFSIIPRYCNIDPNKPPTQNFLAAFRKSISNDQHTLIAQGRKLPIAPFPDSRICGSAMLSQLGVLQHIHNGQLLRKRYIDKNKLLSGALQDRKLLHNNVYAMTTSRTRTMQSAVGFLYGFIPRFHLTEVQMRYAASDLFRYETCNGLAVMVPSIKKVQYQSYLGHRRKGFIKKLSAYIGDDHPGVLIDSLINGFLCKDIKIPCENGNCIDLQDLDQLMEAEESTTRDMSEKSSYLNESMLIIQPLLQRFAQLMLRKLKRRNAPEFALFSGHDTTLKRLMRGMGIRDYRWPPLGSRIVFELWSDAFGKDGQVKILFNGKDYTAEIEPYRMLKADLKASLSACPFESFQEYVTSGIPLHFGYPTRQKACSKK